MGHHKSTNMCMNRSSRRRGERKWKKKFWRTIKLKTSQNLLKNNPYFQEAQFKVNPNRSTNKHVIAKDTETILKAAREKRLITYKEFLIISNADFSWETVEIKQQKDDIFRVLKKKKTKNCQPKKSYPVKLSFNNENKDIAVKQKLRFVVSTHALKEILGVPVMAQW